MRSHHNHQQVANPTSASFVHVAEGEQAAGLLFSKFKYKLQDFIAEVRSLRGKEESARLERLSIIVECKEIEVERRKEIEALRLELAEAVDIRHSLENTVKVMIQESSAMEDKHKSLNLEMKALLQSRNSLAEELKASKYDLECRLAIKVDEQALMKEKLSRHACLFEAFEREASDVKRVMGETCQLVSSKEEQIIQLEKQVQALFSFEKRLIDRINHLKEDNQEIQNLVLAKEKEILSLEGTVESLKFQLESVVEKTEITKTLEIKDALISKLSSQKEELLTEIDNVARVSRKLQGTVTWQETTIEQLKEESVLQQKLILDFQDKLQQVRKLSDQTSVGNEKFRESYARPNKSTDNRQIPCTWHACKISTNWWMIRKKNSVGIKQRRRTG
ncbi:hypothetical protein O6H91_09G015300 [Diphasiastrum complanatum]|uniref:Uncharacterized protein n=1 Tax=Diphasiastrum complanatum TaxID=34168 RepID=A0ACC2CLU4_DIPCM|nr:hypothetical protein O6H91_09G015300 [Diphasiastrum complanatum]